MTARLKAFIFDLDGVIVDSHRAHKQAWRALLTSAGCPVSEEELDFVVEGRKRQEILGYFLGELTTEQQQECGALKERLFWQAADALQTIPGVTGFIAKAHQRGLRMAVATSAGRDRARAMLRQFKLARYFAGVVTGDDVAQGKPEPTIFLRAAESLGVAAEDLLVFEDALAGVQAAKRAGMKCIAIAANGRRALLEQSGAERVIEDFTQISFAEVEDVFRQARAAQSASMG